MPTGYTQGRENLAKRMCFSEKSSCCSPWTAARVQPYGGTGKDAQMCGAGAMPAGTRELGVLDLKECCFCYSHTGYFILIGFLLLLLFNKC